MQGAASKNELVSDTAETSQIHTFDGLDGLRRKELKYIAVTVVSVYGSLGTE